MENDTPNNASIVACVFLAAVTCLPGRFPAMIEGIHIQTHRLVGGIMNYAVEMGSGAVICIPSFIKISSGVQKLIGGIHRHRQQHDLMSLLYFFKARKVGL
jgi:hypothetical protein